MANKPIFFDATGRRAARVSFAGWVLAVVSTILGGVFLATLFAAPQMAQLHLGGQLTPVNVTALEPRAKDPALLKSFAKLAARARAQRAEQARLWKQRSARHYTGTGKKALGRPLSIAFYTNWNNREDNFPALERALPKLDWVSPVWLYFGQPNFKLNMNFDTHMAAYVRATKPSAAILPALQNASGGNWDGPGLASLLADSARRKGLVDQVTGYLAAHKLQGLVVDFEEVPDSAHGNLQLFLHELSTQFAPRGLILAMAAPFDDERWPYADYARIADYTILMAYDEHDPSDEPGSIAGQSWFETTLDKRMKVLAPDRTIIAIGGYAYDWNGGPADARTYEEVMIAAQDAGAKVDFDDATNNPHFSYIEKTITHATMCGFSTA